MERFTLKASKRDVVGKKVAQLRREGKLPAVLYGRHVDKPIAVTLDRGETSKVMKRINYSSLVLIDLDGEEHNVLVRDFQVDAILRELTHVDFLVVSLTETVRAEVSVVLEGKSPVITNLGGLLVNGLEHVEVEALPQDLPERFIVDVSGLENFGDGIFVRDLVVPANVTVLSDPDELLVVANAPVTEAEAAPRDGAAAAEAAPAAAPAAGGDAEKK
ncbi:MAG: 50S ribosomal protein L25 [Anaerolineales bacterium]|nr:50S ribosomal protein L25 [Anaerolineales bacterium]MCL4256892.1 50S ribosomal protein L25 [Anaerolineales bacterium]